MGTDTTSEVLGKDNEELALRIKNLEALRKGMIVTLHEPNRGIIVRVIELGINEEDPWVRVESAHPEYLDTYFSFKVFLKEWGIGYEPINILTHWISDVDFWTSVLWKVGFTLLRLIGTSYQD